MHVYLNRAETAAIIRWALGQLEEIHSKLLPSDQHGPLHFYEGLILKLEGHRDNATTRKDRS